jgi:hypothetical protein
LGSFLFFKDFFWSDKKVKFFQFLKQQFSLILKLFLSGIFAIGLSAFFTLRFYLKQNIVQVETMFEGYYHFSVHFATLFQLFISNFWGDGASVWGPNDDMSFMIGYLHWIVPVILIFVIAFLIFKNKKKLNALDFRYWLILLTIFMGFGAVFMAHNKSTFIWLLFPIIQKVQFPWRFLGHSAFLFSFSIAGSVLFLEKLKSSKKELFQFY